MRSLTIGWLSHTTAVKVRDPSSHAEPQETPVPLTDVAPLEATTEIDAPPAAVWALVSDLRRMPRWSPQCAKNVYSPHCPRLSLWHVNNLAGNLPRTGHTRLADDQHGV